MSPVGPKDGRDPVSYSLPQTNEKVLELLRPHLAAGVSVLDVGAGEGYLALRVARELEGRAPGARLVACDLFPEGFRVEGVPCQRVDLDGGLPFPDRSFDLAYSVEVFEHLEDQFGFLRESCRVVRPGGRFVFSTPNLFNLWSRIRFLLLGFSEMYDPLPLGSKAPQHIAGHVHPTTPYFALYAAERAGFRLAGLHVDRLKKGSIAAFVLLKPLLAVAGWLYRARLRAMAPAILEENRELLRRLSSFDVLVGRTIVLDLVRRG
jgi:SAM-dependent methyltransferase